MEPSDDRILSNIPPPERGWGPIGERWQTRSVHPEINPTGIPALDEIIRMFNRGLLTQPDFRERILEAWQSGKITGDQFKNFDPMQAGALLGLRRTGQFPEEL